MADWAQVSEPGAASPQSLQGRMEGYAQEWISFPVLKAALK